MRCYSGNDRKPELTSNAALVRALISEYTVDSMLLQHLKIDTGHEKMWDELQLSHPHLFASTPTFVSEQDLLSMLTTVQAVERVSHLYVQTCFLK